MDQDSSLNNSFDFTSQSGVMSLLASIRASNLNPAQKNELRDLVFLYTNGGGDVSVRIALEQKLIANNIKPVVKEKKIAETKSEPKPELAFGSYRPAPIFKTPTPVKVDLAEIAQSESANKETSVVPAASEVVSAPSIVAAPVAQTMPVPRPLPVVKPSVVTAPVVRPRVQETKPVTAAVSPQASRSVPVSPKVATNTLQANAPVSSANSNYLDRIREIKSAVNSKVGNPVNLVDINNEVGREYMNALLEAMKRLSGGAAGQIDVAMERLETAYLAVELAVAEHSKSKVAEEVVSSAEEAQTVASGFQDIAPVIEQVPIPAVQVPTQKEVSYPAPVLASVTEAEVPVQSEVFTNESNWTENTSAPIQPSEISPVQPVSGFVTDPSTVIESANISVGIPPANSLAQSARILTPQDLPAASSLASSYSGDPLHIREIDDGLDQLLSDWVLFNKSGLFGTGPKGREHPLFKKIADLQIPILLSGRFEGSTQEIKQSITDYMNGWRYEQGIIYEQGETFEHYLRRVIKQILDLQNKRREA